MILNLTQEHIDKALETKEKSIRHPNWGQDCPMGICLQARDKGLFINRYGLRTINGREYDITSNLPRDVKDFITTFDEYLSMDQSNLEYLKPFSFHLSAECFML